MTNAVKPPLSYEEQIELLKSRKLIINNDDFAKNVLSHINYYRFSAYSLGLRKDNIFKENITFEHIYKLYQFDANLRHMIFQQIEIIEITIRTKISYYLALKYGPLCYLNCDNFANGEYHADFLRKFNAELERQSETAFVKHHNEKYGGNMPIWVASELFSFGMMSQLYSNMKGEDKKAIASSLKVSNYHIDSEYLRSWLGCLSNLRNICAHYGRIYNRNLNRTPKLYKEHSAIKRNRLFSALLVMKRLVYDREKWESFIIGLMALIEKYDVVNLSYLGFPDNWDQILYDE